MKKLMIMIPIAIGMATFAVGCTATSIEEEDYETEIQIIDKEHARRPGKQKCEEEEQEQQSGND